MANSNEGARASRRTRRSSIRRRARRRISRGWWVLLAGLVLLAVADAVLVYRLGWLDRQTLERVGVPLPESPVAREVTLYFADPRWSRLVAETRQMPARGGATETIQYLVAALAEGPRGDGAPVLPRGARLRGAYLGQDGVAIIDFEPQLASFDPGGVSGEILTVFALVHTISENVSGIRSVQILVGGEERETLAGHVKISEPLTPDPQWTGEK